MGKYFILFKGVVQNKAKIKLYKSKIFIKHTKLPNYNFAILNLYFMLLE